MFKICSWTNSGMYDWRLGGGCHHTTQLLATRIRKSRTLPDMIVRWKIYICTSGCEQLYSSHSIDHTTIIATKTTKSEQEYNKKMKTRKES